MPKATTKKATGKATKKKVAKYEPDSNAKVEGTDLVEREVLTLQALAKATEPMSRKEIRKVAGQQRLNTPELTKRGYLKEEVQEGHGRTLFYSITAKGRNALKGA